MPLEQAATVNELSLVFCPEEQDEENYAHQQENRLHFSMSLIDNQILSDLDKEQLTEVDEPSFLPPTAVIQLRQSVQSVDRAHLVDNLSTHSIAAENRSLLKPLRMINAYPQSDCEGPSGRRRPIVIPLPRKPELPVDLFSEKAESARLVSAEKVSSVRSEPA